LRDKDHIIMARVYMLVDDLDNDIRADGSIEFTFEGVTYNLDSCDDDIKRFQETLQPYIDAVHERKPVRRHRSKPGSDPTTRDQRHQQIGNGAATTVSRWPTAAARPARWFRLGGGRTPLRRNRSDLRLYGRRDSSCPPVYQPN
jgi:hypothetical protein